MQVAHVEASDKGIAFLRKKQNEPFSDGCVFDSYIDTEDIDFATLKKFETYKYLGKSRRTEASAASVVVHFWMMVRNVALPKSSHLLTKVEMVSLSVDRHGFDVF